MREDSGDKKKAIFESTLELIRDNGFHGATMSLVAAKAGVAAGTVYHYFESKDQLICELYEYNRQRVASVIEESITASDSYRDNFFRIWSDLYDFFVREPNVLIFFEQFINSPFSSNKFPNYSQGRLFDFFAAGCKKGIFKPIKPEILLLLVTGSVSTAAKLHVFGKKPVSKADQERIAEALWDGISNRNNTSNKTTT